MKTFLKKIKSTKEATAYKYFEENVEVDEALALADKLDDLDDETANLIRAFVARYNGDDGEALIEQAKVPQGKGKKAKKAPVAAKAIYQPYHDNGGLGVLDYYADELGIDYDPLVHTSSRYRLPRLKDTAEARCKYLAKLWHGAIDLARAEGDQNWFTRIVRHQIAAQTKGNDALKKKSLKGIPMPKDA